MYGSEPFIDCIYCSQECLSILVLHGELLPGPGKITQALFFLLVGSLGKCQQDAACSRHSLGIPAIGPPRTPLGSNKSRRYALVPNGGNESNYCDRKTTSEASKMGIVHRCRDLACLTAAN